jgi:peptidylprolyl isomerase
MKKSEKLKGKAAVENRKKQYTRYAIAGAAVIAVLLIAVFYLFNTPAVAKTGDTVMVYYSGTLDNGTVFDSNADGDPLIFTIGNKTVIPGFEEAVIGMTVNSTKTVHIPVEKAYGPHLDSLVLVMNRTDLPKDMDLVVGNRYIITRKADGAASRVMVINITRDTVTLDGNNILTGQNLTFTIQFVGLYKK